MTNHIIPQRDKSIILNGFMGVGKTTVGHLLSSKLNRPFMDVDEEIEKEYQMPITNIFQKFGEKGFRQIEKETALSYVRQQRQIISLGGGAFMQEAIREACLEHGIVVHLDISWEVWKERMETLVETRPVLQNKTMKEIETLFYERRNIYRNNHIPLMTDSYNEEEVAQHIVTLLSPSHS